MCSKWLWEIAYWSLGLKQVLWLRRRNTGETCDIKLSAQYLAKRCSDVFLLKLSNKEKEDDSFLCFSIHTVLFFLYTDTLKPNFLSSLLPALLISLFLASLSATRSLLHCEHESDLFQEATHLHAEQNRRGNVASAIIYVKQGKWLRQPIQTFAELTAALN